VLDYEWLPKNGMKYRLDEQKKAYQRYISAKTSSEKQIRDKWFDYWLDYLILRNMYD